MRVLTAGRQMSRAVKNVGRLRQIIGVFARHGFETFLIRMGLGKNAPHLGRQQEELRSDENSSASSDFSVENATANDAVSAANLDHNDLLTIPIRLRAAFEELGPTFVKLGQLLSNRPDMLPDEYIEEFKKLQDNVNPLPYSAIAGVIERELGGKVSDHFSWFNEVPLASASIGQVHEATLPSGEDVVVKVQRPDIEAVIKSDISILNLLAGLMERYLPETRVLAPKQIVEEFFRTLLFELNFFIEAGAAIKVAENFRDNPRIKVPKIYKQYSTERVLTQERLKGVRITDVEALKAQGIDPKEIVDVGGRAFFKMVLMDGFFHGDLHGGNLFAMKDEVSGQSVLGIIDFGIMGRLSEKAKDSFVRMLLALLTEDYESLCYEYADLATYGAGIDFEKFQSEVRNTLSPYMGLSLKDMQVGQILIEATRIAVRYKIKIPSEWMIIFKAIFTIEGLGRQLDPDFDVLTLGNDLVKTVFKDRYSLQRLGKDTAWVVRDVTALAQTLPRQIRWMFRKLNSNDFAFEVKIKEVELLRRQVERSYRGLSGAFVTGALFVATAISLRSPDPTEGVALFNSHYTLHGLLFLLLALVGLMGLYFRRWK